MTDQEPNVQVPVSLIEKALRMTDDPWLVVQYRALLSQPTPTAEMCPDCGEHAFDGRKCVSCDYRFEQDDAAPPRIDDMAPGTTFSARFVNPADGGGRFTNIDGFGIRDEEGRWCIGRGIDPPTIRDVTPPKDAS